MIETEHIVEEGGPIQFWDSKEGDLKEKIWIVSEN